MRNKIILTALLAATVGTAGAQSSTAPATTTAAPAVNFSDVPAGHWAQEAVKFIADRGLIQGYPDGTFRGSQGITRYEAAMIFHRLLQSGALSNMEPGDLTTVSRGMQEVSAELAAISTRVGDLERASADQLARVTALEQRIAALPADGSAGAAALEARIAALETANGVTTVTPGSTVVVAEPSNTTAEAPAPARTYLGATANWNTNTTFNVKTLVYGGTVGTSKLFGTGLGGRVNVEYNQAADVIRGDLNATFGLSTGGGLEPYVGIGAGVHYGSSRANSAVKGLDYHGNGLVGADLMITPGIGLFVEANPHYYFTANNANVNKGFVLNAKAGVKLFF